MKLERHFLPRAYKANYKELCLHFPRTSIRGGGTRVTTLNYDGFPNSHSPMSAPTCCCHNGNTVACCTKGRSTNISGNLALQGNPFRTTTQTALFPFCRSPHEQQMCLAGFLLCHGGSPPHIGLRGISQPQLALCGATCSTCPFCSGAHARAASRCDRASRTATLRWRTHLYITNGKLGAALTPTAQRP